MGRVVELTRLDATPVELRKAAKRERNARVVRRILAIAMVLDGADRKSAAQACGMERQTLRDWVHHYNREGLPGLRERRTSNRKSKLSPELEPAFVALVEQGPDPATDGVVRWRRVDLQRVLKQRFDIEVKERAVGNYLARLGYRRLSVRPQHPDADPQAQEAFKKTSAKSSPAHSRRRPQASLSKSGSKMRRGSASKAP